MCPVNSGQLGTVKYRSGLASLHIASHQRLTPWLKPRSQRKFASVSAQILIVDGHSIIFAWPELRALHDSKTAHAREKLTRILTEYQDLSGTHVVLVFDGRGPMITDESEPGGIQVFYSNTGRTADDIIERLVAKYGMLYSITVATSDLLEQQTAIAFGGNCISADGLRKLVTNARSDFNRELKRRNAQ
jgi:uncharacterized protein